MSIKKANGNWNYNWKYNRLVRIYLNSGIIISGNFTARKLSLIIGFFTDRELIYIFLFLLTFFKKY